MELKYIIMVLERLEPERVIPYGFGHPHSYRGYYDQLGFEPCKDVTVGFMLEQCRQAIGTTYGGWKGGNYTMDEDTECHLAYWGDTGRELGSDLLSWMLGEPVGYEHLWVAAR